ncbi:MULTISPECIES: protein kinase [Acidobacterium]|uniref:Non-specific serine/threonine protein kinase n=1 Tax=Acidobacterium capsulatum (strain ATCC 51196 / DSM 11244 / BCRC 80197 / JCM 7670 / NBRC 15755 / NCIMB 13165 / 161) TaxID=240015 RepID=C1F2M9_ACIC5|nr:MULTISPECIES: protein kinase [Acidobacterium]ACO31683.1 non-specific serine/threonine protein kinase [Acidobacterium capsulatum ATCC 51196]
MAESRPSEETLASRIASHRLTHETALRIASQLGNELAAAHAAGRVHGWLSAESILLESPEGQLRVRILHFPGNAPASSSEILSTVAQAHPAAPSGDIHAFGQILAQMREALREAGEPLPDWDEAIERCLATDPEQRFASISQLMRAVDLPMSEETSPVIAIERPPVGMRQWGPFQLLQRLGQGAFGEVYRAWDPVLEREVALKLLLPRGLNPEQQLAEVVAEARAMARVRHANIVPVYGVDRHEGRVGFWSDFVRGRTLSRIVESTGPMPPDEAAKVTHALCDALTAVHDAGLLHRDIKASNTMRDDNGRILLMDFGLSQDLQYAAGYAGTPTYMSPEILNGAAPTVQSDLYAMGVLLLYLCTGAYPLSSESKAAAELRPIPAPVKKVIDQATAKAPGDRYRSARQFSEALTEAIAALHAPATSATSPRRSRRMTWLTAAALLAIAAVALYPVLHRRAQAKAAGTTPAAYQDYQNAESLLHRYDQPGNTQKAIALYQKTLQRSPNFPLAEAGLAQAYWRMYLDTSDQQWAAKASGAANQAAQMNADLADVQRTLGTIHVAQGQYDLGMQELLQARQDAPRSAGVYGALGEAYRQQGQTQQAVKAYNMAMTLAPNDWRWPYLLGAMQIDNGNYKDAEVNLKAALAITPKNSRVLYDLGLVYQKQNGLKDAENAFRQSQQLAPSEITASALASVLLEEGSTNQAVQLYAHIVQQHPKDWDAWGNYASALQWNKGDPATIRKTFQTAVDLARQQLKITPDDPYLVSVLAEYYADLQQPEQSLPLLRKSLVLAPNDPDLLERDAESYEAMHDRTQALQLLDRALQLGFSAKYVKTNPELEALRHDPRAPQAIRN